MALADAKPFAVAHWPLDETSGTRFDTIGSSDLTDNNTVGVGTGKFGNAADFEKDNSEHLSISDNAEISTGDVDLTIRAWVWLESKTNGAQIVSKWSATDTECEFVVDIASDRFRFSVRSGATQYEVLANNLGSPATGTWYLIHAWHDAANNQIGIAVNAGTANALAHSAGVNNGNGELWLGGLSGFPLFADGYFDGLIDDVVLLKNYILDATERTEDYNSGNGVAFADWDGGTTPPTEIDAPDTVTITATEAISISALIPITDNAELIGTEQLSITADISISDTATLTGTETVPISVTLSVSDTATLSGTESTSVFDVPPDVTFVNVGDSAGISATESLSEAVTLTVQDNSIIASLEAFTISALLSIDDTATVSSTEDLLASVSLTVTDQATILSTETVSLHLSFTITDNATLTATEQLVIDSSGVAIVPSPYFYMMR